MNKVCFERVGCKPHATKNEKKTVGGIVEDMFMVSIPRCVGNFSSASFLPEPEPSFFPASHDWQVTRLPERTKTVVFLTALPLAVGRLNGPVSAGEVRIIITDIVLVAGEYDLDGADLGVVHICTKPYIQNTISDFDRTGYIVGFIFAHLGKKVHIAQDLFPFE